MKSRIFKVLCNEYNVVIYLDYEIIFLMIWNEIMYIFWFLLVIINLILGLNIVEKEENLLIMNFFFIIFGFRIKFVIINGNWDICIILF